MVSMRELEEGSDYVVLTKREFLRLFEPYLEPEQIFELLGGYYDGDAIHIWELGLEVGVERDEVVIKKEDWERIKSKL